MFLFGYIETLQIVQNYCQKPREELFTSHGAYNRILLFLFREQNLAIVISFRCISINLTPSTQTECRCRRAFKLYLSQHY